ncbi:NUDIX domain-containing protein [Gloeobacter kilaueensis]|uniref:NUDIX hydrolase n=1 Tax=Gloeobacter kilaueensis (strain ATCC BAA-2537 / CCAP 1431/1 / ULC 316 / JS1) TaxID=1183438 RepID=U5QFY5_GLOK1|nr:NUDIX domain-containing protein [Gloeobacter kilaueensis]AGY56549.1 NUDIX hydrolase [Gloeobacter kilaueensis JS1]
MKRIPPKAAPAKTERPYIPQPLYDQILSNLPIACVDVAIVAQGAVLLVRRKVPPAMGQWWVPGGRVLKDEMMKDAARRKALEEVGIDCHVGPIIHTAETIFPDGPSGIAIHSINSCFFLYPVEANAVPVLDGFHLEYRWVQAIPEGLHPYVIKCLMAAGLE